MRADIQQVMNPPDRQDDFTRKLRTPDYGFVGAKRLDDGTYVGLQRLITTLAICIGIGPYTSYTKRYCFDDISVCLAEYEKIETPDYVPEGWVARRPKVDSDYDFKP